jgi:hypothetical protein
MNSILYLITPYQYNERVPLSDHKHRRCRCHQNYHYLLTNDSEMFHQILLGQHLFVIKC